MKGETFSNSREPVTYRRSREGSRKRISHVKRTRDKVFKVVNTAAWIIDSGAVNHLTNEPEMFSFLGDTELRSVTLANGEKADISAEGRIYIPSLKEEISNVLLVPSTV